MYNMVRIEYYVLTILVVFFVQDVNAVTDEQFEVSFSKSLELLKKIDLTTEKFRYQYVLVYHMGSLLTLTQTFTWGESLCPSIISFKCCYASLILSNFAFGTNLTKMTERRLNEVQPRIIALFFDVNRNERLTFPLIDASPSIADTDEREWREFCLLENDMAPYCVK